MVAGATSSPWCWQHRGGVDPGQRLPAGGPFRGRRSRGRAHLRRAQQHVRDGRRSRQAALQPAQRRPTRPGDSGSSRERDGRDPARRAGSGVEAVLPRLPLPASYLIGDTASGRAAVVDPRRDVQEYLDDAVAAGLAITHVIETHFHADFLSGHLEIAEQTGASIVYGARAAGRVEFDVSFAADGDRILLGDVTLEIVATPGHTPESVCVVVRERPDADPWGVLTGDTSFIGDVGRHDQFSADGVDAVDLAVTCTGRCTTGCSPCPTRHVCSLPMVPDRPAASTCRRPPRARSASNAPRTTRWRR